MAVIGSSRARGRSGGCKPSNRPVLEPHGTTCGRPGAGGWEKGDRERGRVRECSDKHQSTPVPGRTAHPSLWESGWPHLSHRHVCPFRLTPCTLAPMRQTNPILSHPLAAWRTRTIRILDSLPQHGMTPTATLARWLTGSWIRASHRWCSQAAESWECWRRWWCGNPPSNSPPRPERLGPNPLCRRRRGTSQSPAHVEERSSWANVRLLEPPPGTTRTKGKPDIGRGIPQNEASDSPFSPEHAMRQNHEVGRAWSRRHQRRLVLRFSVGSASGHPSSQPASLWSMSASVSSPPSWNQTWGSRVSLPAGRLWSHQVLRSGTRGCNAGVLACSQMKRECGRTSLAYRFGAWDGTRA